MNIVDTINKDNLPKHLAIIMDGNGRWAKGKGMERIFGHKNALTAVRESIEGATKIGVSAISLYAFSTENWKRSESEVIGLMGLFKKFMKSEAKKLLINGVKVRFIGNRSRLDKSIIKF